MNRKSQSAMEYLMTYGWAILVVLIALGALFYLGVFNPKTPSTCNANAPLTCTDVLASETTPGTVTLVLAATGTSSVEAGALTIDSPSGTTCTTLPGDLSISTDTPTSMVWSECGLVGDTGNKLSGSLEVTYTLQGSDVEHTTTVQFSGTIES